MYSADATFGDFLRTWLEQYVWLNRQQNTYATYEVAVRCHIDPAIGAIPLTEVTALDVESVLTKQVEAGAKRGTVSLTHRVMKSGLEFAVNLGLVRSNVARAVTMPRMEKERPQVLTADEAAKLLHYAPGRAWYGRAICTVLLTGMRLGEVRGLRWRHVQLHEDWAEIHVVEQHVDVAGAARGRYEPNLAPLKTVSSARTVRLDELGRQILRDQRHELGRHAAERGAKGLGWLSYDLVFPGKNGGVNTRGVIGKALRGLCNDLDIPVVTVHGLRHTFATLLHQDGEDIVNIQHALGHRHVRMTVDMYVHPNEEKQRGVAGRLQRIISEGAS